MNNKTLHDSCGSLKVKFIEQLIEKGCIKYGNFVLKSGVSSPCYVDLREASMHPALFHNMVELVKEVIPKEKYDGDSYHGPPVAVVGVPYGVVPLAASVAYACNLAYYPVRKETKEYGHKPDVSSYSEFEYIIIEDVMSTGSSIIDTIKKMQGKKITDVIVVVDRELKEDLKKQYPDIRLHSIVRMSDLLTADGQRMKV